jgi:Domain of unknown function (DUF3786)
MCGDRWLQELEESPVPRNYRDAYARAVAQMAGRTPAIDAETAGVTYADLREGRGRFEIPLLNRTYELSWPDLAMRERGCDVEPSYVVQILLLHYLIVSDGIAVRGQWTSFREIPEGRTYYPAFRGGSEERLLGRFGMDVPAFKAAAEALGGRPLALADHAYAFDVLPRLPMAVLLWEGDDEFPPELHILMDATAANYLPTEDIAVISRYLAINLVRAVPKPHAP